MRTKATDAGWVSYLSGKTGLPEDVVKKVWDGVKTGVAEYVGPDGYGILSIPGFGVFERRPHKGHPLNLPDGSYVMMGEYQVLRFRPCDSFKKIVLGNGD